MNSGTAIGNDVLGTAMNTILFGMFGSFLSCSYGISARLYTR